MKELVLKKLIDLPSQFFDPKDAKEQQRDIETEAEISSKNLFSSQNKVDKIKRDLNKTKFNILTCLYFSQFVQGTKFDFKSFESDVLKNKQTIKRHLGKGFMFAIQLLIETYKEIEKVNEPPKGLLGRAG